MWWILLAVVAIPGLYGLHRLCLHLEDRGYLYYRHKKPTPGGHAPFLLTQEFCEPRTSHVIETLDHAIERADDDRYLPDPPDVRRWSATDPPESSGPDANSSARSPQNR